VESNIVNATTASKRTLFATISGVLLCCSTFGLAAKANVSLPQVQKEQLSSFFGHRKQRIHVSFLRNKKGASSRRRLKERDSS
jgi:hypothetical protein